MISVYQRLLAVPFFFLFSSTLPLRAQDCDVNGVRDATEIASGASEDCNENGIPDACEFVPLVFGEIGERPVPRGGPQAMTSGDLDGDGLSDLVVSGWEDAEGTLSTLNIFFNRGGGAFTSALVIETSSLFALEAADLDSDGDLDLVTTNGDRLRIYPNDRVGEVGELGRLLEVSTPPGTEELLVADVDLDGRPDLVTLNPGEGNVRWHPNVGEGSLGEGAPVEKYWGDARSLDVSELAVPGSSLRSFAAGDFDGDGDTDLALAETRDETVVVLANTDGGASFSLLHSLPSIDGAMAALHAAGPRWRRPQGPRGCDAASERARLARRRRRVRGTLKAQVQRRLSGAFGCQCGRIPGPPDRRARGGGTASSRR